MFYNIQDLDKRAKFQSLTESWANVELSNLKKSFSALQSYDIFLSHSFLDAKYIKLIRGDLVSLGYSVYVNWIDDKQLSREQVTKETAEQLRVRMNQSKCLFYVTTENYRKSNWMPWELGYFDALKNRVAILPIMSIPDNSEEYKGTEYLGLYSYITKQNNNSGKETIWINKSSKEYIAFDEWLKGKESYYRV